MSSRVVFFSGLKRCSKLQHWWFPETLARYSTEQPSKPPQTAYDCNPEKRIEHEDLKTKRARLMYQSKKRGILENDILLGEFAEQMLDRMNRKQLMRYDEIINGEHMEWDLYYYIAGNKNLPKDLQDCEVFRMLQDFVKQKTEEMRERTKR